MIRKYTRSAIAVATLVLAALGGWPPRAAAQLPQQGEFSATYCFAGNLTMLAQSKTDLAFSFELTGPVRADSPGSLLDMTSVRCVGLGEVMGGKPSGTHRCQFMDRDGDMVFVRGWYGTDGPTRTIEFLGGTGKYEGISGSGETSELGRFPRIEEGTFQGCTHGGGHYRLP